MISKEKFRYRTARLIIISDLVLFGTLAILSLATTSLLTDELTAILKVLLPIKAVYLTAIIKYAIQNSTVKKEVDKSEEQILTPMYRMVSAFAIYGHVFGIILSVLLFVFQTIPTVDDLQIVIVTLETLFGVYLGLIWADLFSLNKK